MSSRYERFLVSLIPGHVYLIPGLVAINPEKDFPLPYHVLPNQLDGAHWVCFLDGVFKIQFLFHLDNGNLN